MNASLDRIRLKSLIERSLRINPVTILLGPRQSGKTHLSRQMEAVPSNCFDLENLTDLARLQDDPMAALGRLSGLVIIDEVQRMPELFPLLRVLADRPDLPARFLLLGSTSPLVVRGSSESLAGRASFIDMAGFSLGEIEADDYETLWMRGGFPKSYLSLDDKDSWRWRQDYLHTIIERDLPDLSGTKMSSADIRRFLLLLADSHGRSWNHTEASRILGISYKTVQRHVDIFCGALVLRELAPLVTNIRKRLRKTSKYYFRDSGLLHFLLSLRARETLHAHRGYGFSWEGFAIEQIVRLLELRDGDCYSYSVHNGAEMDLVVTHHTGLLGFELKANSAPRSTPSMTQAIEDLGLKRVYVVYPGDRDFPLTDRIDAIGITKLPKLAETLAD